MAAELRRRFKYIDIRTWAKQALLCPLKCPFIIVCIAYDTYGK